MFFVIMLTSCSKEEDGIYFRQIMELKKEYSSVEVEILDLVNIYRSTIGLNQLEKLDIISSVALSHSKYMANQGVVSHDNFQSRQKKLFSNANAKSVGENVGFGYKSAKELVESWLKSDLHKAVIENANFTHFGISTERNLNGSPYFTQIFIRKVSNK